jgi:hypothetical protein
MLTSIFLAKVLGIFYLAIGLGMFISSKFYKKLFDDILKNVSVLFLTGMMTFVLGVVMVKIHNVWSGPWWVILITIFSWAALIKGLTLLIVPNYMIKLSQSMIASKSLIPVATVGVLIIGLIFGYYGFMM